MKNQAAFCLEVILRAPAFTGQANHLHEVRCDSRVLHIPVYYTWQEGPDDLHVFFDKDDDGARIPYNPEFDADGSGDYILPDPDDKSKLCRAYHLGFRPVVDPEKSVSVNYVNRIKDLWSSPCDNRTKKPAALIAFLKKTKSL